jgi:SAM-dependent methyltransferase
VHCLRSSEPTSAPGARSVEPERLDNLAADDPLAMDSRRDLQRVHRAMRSLTILKDAISRIDGATPPRRILELGAGDGSLLLRLARTMRPQWGDVELTLLDRQNLLSASARQAFVELNWHVTIMCMDALDWAQSPPTQHYDLCITTLFLHHFESANLGRLLAGVATQADAFIACEPRRNQIAHLGSRLIGLLGANEVTREDGVKSVAAGFNDRELTEIWSKVSGDWRVDEYSAWPFTHCFWAARTNVGAAADQHER